MKKFVIKNYIQGLASFLDEEKIKWERSNNDAIVIYCHNEEDLFRIGWKFGVFYEKIDATA